MKNKAERPQSLLKQGMHMFSVAIQQSPKNPRLVSAKKIFAYLRLPVVTLMAVQVLSLAGQVQASITAYSSRTAFDSAVGATTLEDFNSRALGVVPVGGTDFGLFTITADVGSGASITSSTASHNFPVDGTVHFKANTFLDHDFTITFDTAITSFGADFFGFNESFALRTRLLAGSDTIDPPHTGGSNALRFFGFQSDTPFTSLTFDGILSDGFGMDNMSFGAVPEPTTLFVWGGLGLCAAVATRRRRRESRN